MKKQILVVVILMIFISCGNKKATSEENIAMLDNAQTPLEASIKNGKEVYLDMCVTCHLPNGKGVPRVYPPLAKSDYLITNQTESIKAVKFGMQGEIVVNGISYNQNMASLGLENDEIADVMNYINNSWGNKNETIITEEQVAKIEK